MTTRTGLDFGDLDEQRSRTKARIAKARKVALANVAATSALVTALKLLRGDDPAPAADALREVRGAVTALLGELDR